MKSLYPNRKVASHVDDSVSTEIELMKSCWTTILAVALMRLLPSGLRLSKSPK